MFGEQTALQLIDPPVGVLVALALASIGVYGIVLGGWASGSTYPLLGGLRSAAQMISYDVAMGLSFVAVFLYAGHAVHLGDRRATGTRLVRLAAAGVVRHLLRVHGRRDQPGAVRPGRGRGRAGRRVQHRVLLDAVRAVLPGRVHQPDQRLGDRHHAVPRRLAGAVADLADRPARTAATGRCSGSSSRCCCSCSSSSGSAARCPGSATTSSCRIGWKVLIPVSLVWIVLVGAVRVLRNAEGLSTTEVLLWVGHPAGGGADRRGRLAGPKKPSRTRTRTSSTTPDARPSSPTASTPDR